MTIEEIMEMLDIESQEDFMYFEQFAALMETEADIDYDAIYDTAVNELGMVYAEPNQVILYDGGTDDYVRQNGSIPSDYSSMKDKLLGKDGE